jgi:hypothetical protein
MYARKLPANWLYAQLARKEGVTLDTPPLDDPLFSAETAIQTQNDLNALRTRAVARAQSSLSGPSSNDAAAAGSLLTALLGLASAAQGSGTSRPRMVTVPANLSDDEIRHRASLRSRMSLNTWGARYGIPDDILHVLSRHRFSGPFAITWTEDQILHEIVGLPVGAIGDIRDAIVRWLNSPREEEAEEEEMEM